MKKDTGLLHNAQKSPIQDHKDKSALYRTDLHNFYTNSIVANGAASPRLTINIFFIQ